MRKFLSIFTMFAVALLMLSPTADGCQAFRHHHHVGVLPEPDTDIAEDSTAVPRMAALASIIATVDAPESAMRC